MTSERVRKILNLPQETTEETVESILQMLQQLAELSISEYVKNKKRYNIGTAPKNKKV